MAGESNQVKWIGIRAVSSLEGIFTQPGVFISSINGITRTLVTKDLQTAAAPPVLHTVTPGKTFYLSSFVLCLTHTTNAYIYLVETDASNTRTRYFSVLRVNTSFTVSQTLAYPIPIPIVAGHHVEAWNDSGSAFASITGWEE